MTDWALFLDFDGTLVEIAPRPDAVAVAPGLPSVLARLRDRLGGALAVVSGRPIATIDGFLAPCRLDAAGLHGIEVRLGGRLHPCRPDDHPDLRRAIADLTERYDPVPGILIEDKGCSVGLHWRLAPERADEMTATARAVAARLGPDYRIQFGKAVAEILPARSGKGPVIASFLEHVPYAGRRPVFIGDDLTDENGFATVNARGGVSVRIGPGDTVAGYRMATPAALADHLARWSEGAPMDLERDLEPAAA